MLTVSYTPFTLKNFTDSILVNVTNIESTDAVPEGNLPALSMLSHLCLTSSVHAVRMQGHHAL